MRTRVFAVLLGILAPVVLVLVGAEVWCRLNPPTELKLSGRYIADDTFNHVFPPNHVETLRVHPDVAPYEFRSNAHGLRAEREYVVPRPRNTARIVVCGDSFVEGHSRDHTVAVRLERLLAPWAASRGLSLEVINAGVGSYSPTLHYLRLREVLLALEPTLVIIAWDMTDPFDDAIRYRALVRRDESGRVLGVRSVTAALREKLRAFMATGLPAWAPQRWLASVSSWSALANRLFAARFVDFAVEHGRAAGLTEREPLEFPIYDALHADTKEWIAHSVSWLERIDELLDGRSIPWMLASYPHRPQLEVPPLRAYFGVLAAQAERLGVPFHAPVEAFAASTRLDDLFLADDMHFTAAGFDLWSAELARFLEAHSELLEPKKATPVPGD